MCITVSMCSTNVDWSNWKLYITKLENVEYCGGEPEQADTGIIQKYPRNKNYARTENYHFPLITKYLSLMGVECLVTKIIAKPGGKIKIMFLNLKTN